MRGSVIKRPRKRQGQAYDQYYVVFDAGKRWNEELNRWVRGQKWEKVMPNTQRAAERLVSERTSQVYRGEYVDPVKITFADFSGVWLEKYARGQVRPGTMAMYEGLFRNHLIPAFGNVCLLNIGVEEVQGLRSAKLADGLSAQTVKHILRLLRQMLEHAVDWGYIRTNPAKKVKNPRIPRREMDHLNPDEVRSLLRHGPRPWYPFFLTAVTTGMRMGELLAMKWSNVDWRGKRYFVKETLTRRRGGHDGGFAEPKTEESAAAVDLSPACLGALKDHKKEQAAKKLASGEDYEDQDLIFATSTGQPLDHKNIVHRQFSHALRDAGLRRIRFHDLRHTCVALLIDQGESPKYIQRQLRHASIDTTFNRYGHLFPERREEAMRRLDERLFGDPSRNVQGSG